MDKQNVTKWIFASIAKHFSSIENLHVTGSLRDTSDKKEWVELKIDGPYIHKLSKDYHRIKIEIDAQIYTVQDREYLYNNLELQGKVLDLFTETISIFKLGNKDTDDGTYVFCIKLDHGDKHSLDVANFGPVNKDENLTVSDIEGHYYKKIKNF